MILKHCDSKFIVNLYPEQRALARSIELPFEALQMTNSSVDIENLLNTDTQSGHEGFQQHGDTNCGRCVMEQFSEVSRHQKNLRQRKARKQDECHSVCEMQL